MRSFLIIQTAFLGDVVLATALVEKLRRFYPKAAIDFLLRRGAEGLLEGHPYLRRTLIHDKKDKWRSIRRLVELIRRERYDVVINVQRFFSSGILAISSGAREVVGFDKNPLSWAFSRRVAHRLGDGRHEIERNQTLIAWISDSTPEMPRLYPSAAAFAAVAESDPYICVAPTSVWFTKAWPAQRWIELIDRLPADHRVFLLGGPADHAACEAIRAAAGRPNVVNRAGALTLLESAALLKGARMNYANDSAPVHLASALDAPMCAVFCSTVPAFGFGPLSTGAQVAQTPLRLDCRPCGLHGRKACPEKHFRCAEIPLERLLEALG